MTNRCAIRGGITAFGLLLGLATAQAADITDLLGTWRLTTGGQHRTTYVLTTVLQAGPHYTYLAGRQVGHRGRLVRLYTVTPTADLPFQLMLFVRTRRRCMMNFFAVDAPHHLHGEQWIGVTRPDGTCNAEQPTIRPITGVRLLRH